MEGPVAELRLRPCTPNIDPNRFDLNPQMEVGGAFAA